MSCSNNFQAEGPPAKGGPSAQFFLQTTVTAWAASAAVAEAWAAVAGPLP